MKSIDRIIGFFASITGLIYLTWLAGSINNIWGGIFFVCEALLTSVLLLYLLNHWDQVAAYPSEKPSEKTLDVFLPVVNEPASLFETTLAAAVEIDHAGKTVWVLDDGKRDEIREQAVRYGARYIVRKDQTNCKSGNLNNAMALSTGEVLLVIDADQTIDPRIAKDLMGHFDLDEKLAIVSTKQFFDSGPKDFNHQPIFYNHVLPGKNADNAAISCGTGVFYRRSALSSVGGFQTWNLVEDLYTSYILHQRGYKSLYVDAKYSIGKAPVDLGSIYWQRGVYALDNLRIFFWKNPLLAKGLSAAQKMHYFETGLSYFISAAIMPVMMILIAICTAFQFQLFNDIQTYLWFRLPSLIMTMLFFLRQSDNNIQSMQYWFSLFPVHIKALALSIIQYKPSITVTIKNRDNQKSGIRLVLPHLFIVVLSVIPILCGFQHDSVRPSQYAIYLMWVLVQLFFFYPVLDKGFGSKIFH